MLVGDIGGTNARLSLWTSSADGAHQGGRSQWAEPLEMNPLPATWRGTCESPHSLVARFAPPAETYHQTFPTKDYDCFEALVKAFLQAASSAAPGAAQPQSAAFACAGARACRAGRCCSRTESAGTLLGAGHWPLPAGCPTCPPCLPNTLLFLAQARWRTTPAP